ncbi:MAG TPA: transketolase C-terminal domain-containing protein, partial [Acidimicrobiia bacterium]|nr:transketolase C-terminal domain-containing protein [Acidimicrobiia bacterium]
VRHVVTLEDNVVSGGFGPAVMESFAAAGLVKEFTNIGVPDGFLPFGAASDVWESVGMDPDSVVERVLSALA